MPENRENDDHSEALSVSTSKESSEITDNVHEEPKPYKPLTADEFRNALKTLSSLGLTWTADRIPRVTAKDEHTEDAFLSDEYRQLQEAYPNLPRELGAVVYHAITGATVHERLVGSADDLKNKVSVVRELLLNSKYRSEFFFKYALKVPYLESVDWEVVFKTHERNVKGMPAVGYALLLFTFHNPNIDIGSAHQNITFAVDLPSIEKAIRTLGEVKVGLEDVQRMSERVTQIGDGNNVANE